MVEQVGAEAFRATWQSRVAETVRGLPEGYADARVMAMALRQELVAALAAAVQPRLNAHLRSMPHETYGEKQALATWVNHELHNELGLAIRCPRTGRPAILIADTRDGKDVQGRFRLEVHDERGRKARTYTASALPDLELMADPPRRESFFRWPTGPGSDVPQR